MNGIRWLIACLVLALAVPLRGWAAPPDPQEVVRSTADRVLVQVRERKAELTADPSQLYDLVKSTVLPHFDFAAMTRSAMGRFWRRATPEQRERLVREFREMLVRTYATALLGYTGQPIEYPPARYRKDAAKVVVPTRVRQAGGPPIPIDYRLKWAQDDGEWLVYDVVIDGVSLVTNYRSSFARLIREGAARAKDPRQRMRVGIDHLIATLAEKNADSGKPKEAA